MASQGGDEHGPVPGFEFVWLEGRSGFVGWTDALQLFLPSNAYSSSEQVTISVEVWAGPSLERVSADNKPQVWTHTPEAVFLQGCLKQGAQLGFAARATATHQQEQQGGAGPNWEQKGSKCWFFPYKVAGSETAQCSPKALRGWLSEELGTACSDLGTKLHFNLQNSFTNSRFSSKGASDTGAKPSHGGKMDLLQLQQTIP